jgi:hypothetical protein
MSFHEKSAWIMGLLLSLTGYWYLSKVWALSDALGETAPPVIGLIAVATVMLIAGAVISHIIIGVINPDEASGDEDERDKQVLRRAGNISGYVLGFGIFAGLWHYYFLADGNMLFHIAVASLIASQVAEYALTILFYRRGV